MTTTSFDKLRLVLPDGVANGRVLVDDGLITAVELVDAPINECLPTETDATGAAATRLLDGDYLLPGLVELHTDNVERHLLPRPSARWPNPFAAILSHDAEVAAAGITTVYDSMRIGEHEGEPISRRELFPLVADAVNAARKAGVLRVDHRLHARCELPDPKLLAALDPLLDDPAVTLLSLMDHTPGQRQWRDVDALRRHHGSENEAARDQAIAERIATGQRHVDENRQRIVERVRERVEAGTLMLASHDDTTADHVAEAVRDAIGIAEFPCTEVAARAAIESGLFTLGGAPNVVRGGSHSGNVAMRQLVRTGLLTGLSSDYVPASTLQAVFLLACQGELSIADAVTLASGAPAERMGIDDRGRIAVGLRADLVHVSVVSGTPVVRATHVAGQRVA